MEPSFDPNLSIFVFGSNLGGRHGAGAAKYAHEHKGARMGVGVGSTGGAYAIPTKNKNLEVLPLVIIEDYVRDFIETSKFWYNRGATFQVTQIGCGYAGYTAHDIAPMFFGSPNNVFFDTKWAPILRDKYRYWGTF